MRRLVVGACAVAAMLIAGMWPAGSEAAPGGCATIQSGTIKDSAGNVITTGFDQYGYNYQAREFNGTYDSVDRKLDGMYWGSTGDFVDDHLAMKWSDDWLSNRDCNGDHKLDRGVGATGISQGWLTNHVVGDYTDADGAAQHYTDFVRIVWTGPGSPLWGQYTVIQENYHDTGGGSFRVKLGAPGFGLNDHWTTLP